MPQRTPVVMLVDETAWSKDACISIPARKGADWRFPMRLDKATMTISNGQPEYSAGPAPRPPASVIDTFDRLRPKAVQMLCGTDLLISDKSRTHNAGHQGQFACF